MQSIAGIVVFWF